MYIPFKINKDKQYRRILGCNWGILKKNILAVNGFDEDYNRAGVGEDFDIDWRLKKHGLKVRSMKGKAIVFHMYHKANYNPSDTEYVEKLMAEKKNNRKFILCKWDQSKTILIRYPVTLIKVLKN